MAAFYFCVRFYKTSEVVVSVASYSPVAQVAQFAQTLTVYSKHKNVSAFFTHE